MRQSLRISARLTPFASSQHPFIPNYILKCKAVIDYTAAGGKKGSPEEMATFLDGVFSPKNFVYLNRQQHLISNIDITTTGKDTANVRAVFHAPMSMSLFPLEYGPMATVGGWYHHTLVRESDGQWRSSSLREEIAYNQTTVHVLVLIVAVVWGLRALSAVVFGNSERRKGKGKDD